MVIITVICSRNCAFCNTEVNNTTFRIAHCGISRVEIQQTVFHIMKFHVPFTEYWTEINVTNHLIYVVLEPMEGYVKSWCILFSTVLNFLFISRNTDEFSCSVASFSNCFPLPWSYCWVPLHGKVMVSLFGGSILALSIDTVFQTPFFCRWPPYPPFNSIHFTARLSLTAAWT